jgi:aspartate racemase
MKTIGLLGGMSWESSREYYRILNEGVRDRLGGLHSAELVMASVDFGPVSDAMAADDWALVRKTLRDRAGSLAAAGAELLLICTNTMHKMADDVAEAADPARLIHIGQCAADEAARRGYSKVALMGTRFTMEEDFYRARLESSGIGTLLPDDGEREWINALIFGELCAGIFRNEARQRMASITARLAREGAEALVLGCTELPLILTPDESPLPILDTMDIHCAAALDAALEDQS